MQLAISDEESKVRKSLFTWDTNWHQKAKIDHLENWLSDSKIPNLKWIFAKMQHYLMFWLRSERDSFWIRMIVLSNVFSGYRFHPENVSNSWIYQNTHPLMNNGQHTVCSLFSSRLPNVMPNTVDFVRMNFRVTTCFYLQSGQDHYFQPNCQLFLSHSVPEESKSSVHRVLTEIYFVWLRMLRKKSIFCLIVYLILISVWAVSKITGKMFFI